MKIAVVVGHNKIASGADSVAQIESIGNRAKVSEFEFNKQVAEFMEILAWDVPGLEIAIVYRRPGMTLTQEIRSAYAMVNESGADASIELHFNAAHPAATGTETLSSGSVESSKLASCMQVAVLDHLGLRSRGIKTPVRQERGYLSLHSGRCPAVVTEPFFGSNPSDCEAVRKAGGEVGLAEAYIKGLKAYMAKQA